MKIPIENIYFLLCYAWNKLDEKEKVKVTIDNKTELLDLFTLVLIRATKTLLKRGIDKHYINNNEEISGIKGKLLLTQTIKQNLLFKQRTICNFDELSENIIVNRIIATTIDQLIKTREINKTLKKELISLRTRLPYLTPIELNNRLFSQIRLNRNNQFYGFILNICQIIHENSLPSEELGNFLFTDFTRDERKMNQLFEGFIRSFYKIEQNEYQTVKKETIQWQFTTNDTFSSMYLPQMETDITLENDDKKIIIDAKYYSQTMTSRYEKEKIHSSNLYQLFSYLINQENGSSKTMNATGILLYPTIDNEYNLDYQFNNHKIQIRTINLNTHWTNISIRLKEIVKGAS